MFWLCFFRTFNDVTRKWQNTDGVAVKRLSATLRIRLLHHHTQ